MTSQNLAALHRQQSDRYCTRTALRRRGDGFYGDLSWAQYRAEAVACASALIQAGLLPGDRVAILSENRVEWLIADMGILAAAAVTVSPHASLPARLVCSQLLDAGVVWLFASGLGQLEKVRRHLCEIPLRGLVTFDSVPGATSWHAFLARGRGAQADTGSELASREAFLGPESLAALVYTSGTTSDAKGVMLSHGNLIGNVRAVLEVFQASPETVLLNWLPLSHIYARTMDHYLSLAAGAVLSLARSTETVLEDLKHTRPTCLHAVPRFYERVLANLHASTPEETAQCLRDVFGGRIERLGSGGAPLSPTVGQAYLEAGLPILQGYGLTESSPVVTFNRRDRHKIDTVGCPLPGVEVRIAADGEVLTRGAHVMKGYWNQLAATAEIIRDGWLHTGDLGVLDADGFLKITGRKKDLLVLSNGKKVVPSRVEGLLAADPYVDQAFVCGDGQSQIAALIVPRWEALWQALPDLPHDPAGPVVHPKVSEFLRARIDAALCDLAPWERIRKFRLLARPFSVANEELTVSQKLRRQAILRNHHREVESLFEG